MLFFRDIIGHLRGIEILQSFLEKDEIPQAFLFMGEEGIGKKTVAQTFANALLCLNRAPPDPRDAEDVAQNLIEPCGTCLSCRKMEDKNHPDFLMIEPEGAVIKIDQIRDIQERVRFKPLDGPRKVILIDPADRLNAAAANGLLKLLEEPPSYAVLILISGKPASLPQTVLSRCQKVYFYPLSLSHIEAVLMERKGWGVSEARLVTALTGGKLGEAVSMEIETARTLEEGLYSLVSEKTLANYEALFDVATTFSRDAEVMEKCLYYLAAWFRDVLVLQSVADPSQLDASWLVLSWRHDEIKQWAGRMNLHEVGKFLADLQEIQQAQIRNINRQLALETLLMQLRDKLPQKQL
jgi:DNA polymerase-3 subunit delta'